MNVYQLVTILAVLVLALGAGFLWWRRGRRKSPAERERARRLAVYSAGRFTEGVLIDDPSAQSPSPNPELVFYRYRATGMEYTAAQDISALADRIHPASCRPGTVARVKYDPRRPSNSIIICELWSGLPAPREEASISPPGGDWATQGG